MLKRQYFGHLMRRTDSLEKTLCWERLKAGGEGGERGWGERMASLTLWTWVWASSGSWWWTGRPPVLQSMGSQRVRHDGATEHQQMVSPEVMYRGESWTIKKAEPRGLDAFQLCCWRRLLRVPWTARRSNHSILKKNWGWSSNTWPPDVKGWLTAEDPDAGKDWGQEEKGLTEDEMVGRHHRLNEHEFEQTPGNSEGQGSLACCSPWSRKESDTT